MLLRLTDLRFLLWKPGGTKISTLVIPVLTFDACVLLAQRGHDPKHVPLFTFCFRFHKLEIGSCFYVRSGSGLFFFLFPQK